MEQGFYAFCREDGLITVRKHYAENCSSGLNTFKNFCTYFLQTFEFVLALLISYLDGEEALNTAGLIIARFENTTILPACRRCLLPSLTCVDGELNFRSFDLFLLHIPSVELIFQSLINK